MSSLSDGPDFIVWLLKSRTLFVIALQCKLIIVFIAPVSGVAFLLVELVFS
jgi:hypothetical protein